MKKLNVLSMFDGISCGRVALERAGLGVGFYFASEVDKWAIKISQKNWPEIEHLGDALNWPLWHLPKIDLMMGGSPCQSFSIAGKRKGLKDPRGKLFFEFIKAWKCFKPKYFLFENVARMPKDVKDYMTKVFGVEPIQINSNLVSAQNRNRLYWTNIPNIGQPEDLGISLQDVLEGNENAIYQLGRGKNKGGYKMGKSTTLSSRSWTLTITKVQTITSKER